MSKQPNVTLIGGFVAGAIVLLIAGLLVFGSGKLFSQTGKYVLFFEGSVKGLNVGAPVDFRGVRVGSVTNVQVVFNSEDVSLRIPVFIEIDPNRLTLSAVGAESSKKGVPAGKNTMDLLVERGLRASLTMQSLVTGLLSVDLDFHPDMSPRYAGIQTGYPELPTIPSRLEKLTKTLDQIPIDELIEKIQSAISGIDRFVNSPKLEEALVSLSGVLSNGQNFVKNFDTRSERVIMEMNKLLRELNSQVGPLATELRAGVKDTRTLVGSMNTNFDRVSASADLTLKTAQEALKRADSSLSTVQGMLNDRSGLGFQLSEIMDQFADTARSIRALTDYLDRHPEALIRGKRNQEDKK
jgi:paraquat-inducible protein B